MNNAYPLFPVIVLTLAAWLVTRLFASWEIFPLKTHRKFWNYLLLVTFLVSGLLGLLSVVKVNYKLEIPGYENYLKWHVSFGIAMVIISFLHLSWHLKYYFSFSKGKDRIKNEIQPAIPESEAFQLKVLLFLLGFSTIITQVVFIREFITVLSGNELVTGIVLSGWMLLTGWGALAGSRSDFGNFSIRRGFIMLATLPVLAMFSVSLLYWLKKVLYPPGTEAGLDATLISVFLLLFPVCFLSGWLFTCFSALLSESGNKNLIGKSYAFESVGSLAGGLFFGILAGRYFDSFVNLTLVASTVLITAFFLLKTERKTTRFTFPVLAAFMLVFIMFLNPDRQFKKLLFPNQEIIKNKVTRYGNLVVTGQAGQQNVYENNDLLFYTHNLMQNEEAVHFAMVQHKNPKSVLLISGGIAGMIPEIKKYDVDKITCLEINPEIFSAFNSFSDSVADDQTVAIVKSDIRTFVGRSKEQFDVILMNLPPPSTLGLNRFYTAGFFELLKRSCDENTVICTGLPSTANYAEGNALETNASLWKTLGTCFQNRLFLTGERNYFLASVGNLSPQIAELIANRGIENEYVNQYYINDALLAMRSESVVSQFFETASVNEDFKPVMFISQVGHWLSIFGGKLKWLAMVPILLFAAGFLKQDRITAGLYTAGFTAASLEVILLLVYQVWFGSIYLETSLFFAVFMTGLAVGSYREPEVERNPAKRYFLFQFALAALALFFLILPALTGVIAVSEDVVRILFFLLVFAVAFVVGNIFQLAAKLQNTGFRQISGKSYSIDLAGSALGAFITVIVLLPLAGLVFTSLILAGLNIFSGLLAFSVRKQF